MKDNSKRSFYTEFITRVKYTLIKLLCIAMVVSYGVEVQALDKEEVTVWMFDAHQTDAYHSWYEKVTSLFEEKNPGATLNFVFGSMEKLQVAALGGISPDVALVSMRYARSFYESGMFLELNKYIDTTPHMALEEFLPAAIAFGEKDGKIFGFPWSFEARTVAYNTKHMAEAGLNSRPEGIGTWDDLVNSAKRLVIRDGDGTITRSGFIMRSSMSDYASYLYSNGGNFYNEDATAVAFNDSKGIEALEYMYRWVHEFDATRPRATASSDLYNGRASMAVRDTTSIPGFVKNAPDFTEWLNMAPIPRGPHGQSPSTVTWNNLFTISYDTPNPDLAWNFLKLWLSPELTVERFLHWGGNNLNSARLDILRSPEFASSIRQFPYLESTISILNYARPYPHIRFAEIEAAVQPLYLQAVRNGTLSAEAALAEMERLANATLAD